VSSLAIYEQVATLPAVYESAKTALANCERIDECQQWADKSRALASYAKQAEDATLMNHAMRIQARAIRRAGELLEAVESGAPGPKSELTIGGDSQLNRREVADQAGMSERQQYTAQRVARVESQEFEQQVESNTPPTITALAEQGKRTAHVSHNSGENEWYTPPKFIEAARKVMGGIDLDPASSEIANKNVKADKYFTKDDDGLNQKWGGNVWLNPPYAQPLMSQFAGKVVSSHKDITQAIVLVNNATETLWFQSMARVCSAVCFPSSRIRFLKPEGEQGSPLQGQAILYFGGNVDKFTNTFSEFGMVFKQA